MTSQPDMTSRLRRALGHTEIQAAVAAYGRAVVGDAPPAVALRSTADHLRALAAAIAPPDERDLAWRLEQAGHQLPDDAAEGGGR
ncbi:hypothetical protein [Streptomyces youssoufiensis]